MKQVFAMLLVIMMAVATPRTAAAAPAAPATSASVAPAHAAPFNVTAATDAYMAQLSPQARARSDAYFAGGYWLILWDALVALGVAWLLLGSRLSARMRDAAERITRCAGCRPRSTRCNTSC